MINFELSRAQITIRGRAEPDSYVLDTYGPVSIDITHWQVKVQNLDHDKNLKMSAVALVPCYPLVLSVCTTVFGGASVLAKGAFLEKVRVSGDNQMMHDRKSANFLSCDRKS